MAQAQAGLSLGLGAGAVVPTGSMADINSTGWTGQASLRVKPAVSPLGFQVDASYSRLGLDSDLVDGHTSTIAGTANAVFAFPSAAVARPYLIGGVGVYNMKATAATCRAPTTKFGANAGAGLRPEARLGLAVRRRSLPRDLQGRHRQRDGGRGHRLHDPADRGSALVAALSQP